MSRNLARAPETNAFHTLLQQADDADVRLTPGMAEGLARGNPRMIAYVADLIAVRGKRPAIEPREEGGLLEPGKTYTINEKKPEAVVGADGSTRTINGGNAATFTANAPGYVVPPPPAPNAEGRKDHSLGGSSDPAGTGYSPETVAKLDGMMPHIMKASKIWGVDPHEMMLAIGEEYDTRKGAKSLLDGIQDWMARRGMNIGTANHRGADIGPANFAVHNAGNLLDHYNQTRDPRLILRGNSPDLPDNNISKWLESDEGTAYATGMHMARYHERFDPMLSQPLSDEDRHRMGVMFFRQGDNFVNRYARQRVEGNPGMNVTTPGATKPVPLTEDYVKRDMLERHTLPPELKGRTTPNIPKAGDDSFVSGYSAKHMQLQGLLEKHSPKPAGQP